MSGIAATSASVAQPTRDPAPSRDAKASPAAKATVNPISASTDATSGLSHPAATSPSVSECPSVNPVAAHTARPNPPASKRERHDEREVIDPRKDVLQPQAKESPEVSGHCRGIPADRELVRADRREDLLRLAARVSHTGVVDVARRHVEECSDHDRRRRLGKRPRTMERELDPDVTSRSGERSRCVGRTPHAVLGHAHGLRKMGSKQRIEGIEGRIFAELGHPLRADLEHAGERRTLRGPARIRLAARMSGSRRGEDERGEQPEQAPADHGASVPCGASGA